MVKPSLPKGSRGMRPKRPFECSPPRGETAFPSPNQTHRSL
jgi:hypothetical protein